MFSKAIVRQPGKSMINGLSSANRGIPDYHMALQQHESYVLALKKCGLALDIYPADENFPDSTFVEDTAVLTPHCAIITNPGALVRRNETAAIKEIIQKYYSVVETIDSPGTLDGGDVMRVGNYFYIGLSARTNVHGAEQLLRILNIYGMSGSLIKLEKVLHLKTGLAYLENNNLAACGAFVTHPEFKDFNIIEIPEEESYAANCLWINGTVLIPADFPVTRKKISQAGYPVIEVDMSEFRKLDGGLSCLSLRF